MVLFFKVVNLLLYLYTTILLYVFPFEWETHVDSTVQSEVVVYLIFIQLAEIKHLITYLQYNPALRVLHLHEKFM